MIRDGGGSHCRRTSSPPRVQDAYKEEKTDPVRSFARWGMPACSASPGGGGGIPKEYGGLGAGYVTYGLLAREVERVDSGYRSMMSVQSLPSLCTRSTPMARKSSARSTCRGWPAGELIGCFGLTEPDAGSDPGGMKTRAEKVPATGYRLTGNKTWISNATDRRRLSSSGRSRLPMTTQIRFFVLEKGL